MPAGAYPGREPGKGPEDVEEPAYEEELRRREEAKNATNSTKKRSNGVRRSGRNVFHPYKMIKDHRTDFEVGNVQPVMDGELDGFIKAYLMNEKGKRIVNNLAIFKNKILT